MMSDYADAQEIAKALAADPARYDEYIDFVRDSVVAVAKAEVELWQVARDDNITAQLYETMYGTSEDEVAEHRWETYDRYLEES